MELEKYDENGQGSNSNISNYYYNIHVIIVLSLIQDSIDFYQYLFH